jgi:CRP-like cAMP-binding protein
LSFLLKFLILKIKTKKTMNFQSSNIVPDFLQNEDIARLESIGKYVSLKRNETLIEQGTKNKNLFFILKGTLRGYYIDEEGTEKDIFLPPENAIAGAPDSLFKDEITQYNFMAIEESVVFGIDIDVLEEIGYENPRIMRFYLMHLKKAFSTVIRRMQELIAEKPEKRYQSLHINRPDLVKNAKKKYLATFIGVTPNSLSRIRKKTEN